MVLTPAFWGPGSPYLAYPPGQPGVPDVVPIMQAKQVPIPFFHHFLPIILLRAVCSCGAALTRPAGAVWRSGAVAQQEGLW